VQTAGRDGKPGGDRGPGNTAAISQNALSKRGQPARKEKNRGGEYTARRGGRVEKFQILAAVGERKKLGQREGGNLKGGKDATRKVGGPVTNQGGGGGERKKITASLQGWSSKGMKGGTTASCTHRAKKQKVAEGKGFLLIRRQKRVREGGGVRGGSRRTNSGVNSRGDTATRKKQKGLKERTHPRRAGEA